MVRERLTEWGTGAALEVTAEADTGADVIAAEAMSALRFLMRNHIQVNVEAHKIGLVGEVPEGIRHYIVLWERGDAPLAAAGSRRIGGTVPFTFTDQLLDKWEDDPIVGFLGDQLERAVPVRTAGGARGFTALQMLDTGFRSLNPSLRVLTAAIDVEVLYSRGDVDVPQSTAIARRIAYLTCQGGCGRTAPCPYTEAQKGRKRLLHDLQRLAASGDGWQCSAFLDVVAPDAVQGLRFLRCSTRVMPSPMRGARTSTIEPSVT